LITHFARVSFRFIAAVQLRFISLAMNFEASTWFTVDTAHSQNRYRPIERCLVASGKVLHSARRLTHFREITAGDGRFEVMLAS
jgi:hypothetical protein